MSDSEDLYQIALLIDQLKHDDVQLRVNASSALVRIAQALGPERTRDELVPFLSETTDDDNEVLIVIAEKIGVCVCLLMIFSPFVSLEYSHYTFYTFPNVQTNIYKTNTSSYDQVSFAISLAAQSMSTNYCDHWSCLRQWRKAV